MDHKKIVPPNTARIVEGLRDTGYTFEAAIADLIDNSIEADAASVAIQVGLTADHEVLVHVADDGYGMDITGLENAMRYGADEKEDQHRLGRFGLGLKTASTSFCRRLTVISKPRGKKRGKKRPDVSAATWDLDEIMDSNSWVLALDEPTAEESDLFADALEALSEISDTEIHSGTVVFWDKVDRLLRKQHGAPFKDPDAALRRRLERLEWHLRTVFQRYLDPSDDRARTVRIFLNGEELESWDPFCEAFDEVTPEKVETWPITDGKGKELGELLLRAFILPPPNEVDDKSYRDTARISNNRQGIFVYRENRLIEGPDWLTLGAADTHLNYLRVELSVPAPLDPILGVGIKKSGLHLDPGLLDALDDVLTPIRREADNRNRRGRAKKAAAKAGGKRPADRTIEAQKSHLKLPQVTKREDGSVTLANNREDDIEVLGPGGSPNPDFRILVGEATEGLSVVHTQTLEDAVLWAPSLGAANADTQVSINTSHDWYQRAYLPNSANSPLVQAIEFLFFSLAQAEMNNTDLDLDGVFEDFRVEVSRNLRRLVSDLPEPDDDSEG